MKNLNSKQLAAGVLLVQGLSGVEVAKEVGVFPETVSRWKSLVEFEAYLNILQKEALEGALIKLRGLTVKATQVLADIMENSSDANKLRAAVHVLTMLNFNDPEKLVYRMVEIGKTDPVHLAQTKYS